MQVSSATYYLFSGKYVDFSIKHKPKLEHLKVRTTKYFEFINLCCDTAAMKWSLKVIRWLAHHKGDLVAADCVGHQSSSFFSKWKNHFTRT